jgi:hypothetical protein
MIGAALDFKALAKPLQRKLLSFSQACIERRFSIQMNGVQQMNGVHNIKQRQQNHSFNQAREAGHVS